jgi:2-polyprenyl-3-methyl-5-hydroxy-6-metoxy-1,4-benzoquinol methylase
MENTYDIRDLENKFQNIYNNNIWDMGQNESKSGLGSTNEYTINIRNKLVSFIKEKSITNLLDTSCGDWHWMKSIKDDLPKYIGLDIVKEIVEKNNELYSNDNIKFINSDFLTFIKQQGDKSIDLIFCRHTLEHLPTEYNLDFLKECRRVCKYLFVTGYNNLSRLNTELPEYMYRPINLKLSPYSDTLNHFYDSEFYDGPTNRFLSEMIMNVYNFDNSNITAIVNVFKREYVLEKQIEAIKNQSIPPKCIMIWNNGNNKIDLTKYKNDPFFKVFDNNYNSGVWSRFLIGQIANTEYIAIFDDDTIPGKNWFKNCLECMKKKEALYGTIGVIFNDANQYSIKKRYGWDGSNNGNNIEPIPVDIVGHAWFFKKDWLSYFVRETPKVNEYFSVGEDMTFSFMLQKYANIPTYVPPHPSHDLSMFGSIPHTAWRFGGDGNSGSNVGYTFCKAFLDLRKRGLIILEDRQNATSTSDFNIFIDNIRKLKPFAIIRPCDGEYHILQNNTITNIDYWTFNKNGKLFHDLHKAINLASNKNCYVGIPCGNCNLDMAKWYIKTFKLNPFYTTFANIFVNKNWKPWISFLTDEKIQFIFIGPNNLPNNFLVQKYINIPLYFVNDWDEKGEEYLKNLLDEVKKYQNKIFIFSAGPIAKILISHAWNEHPHNIYLDIGSSLDLFMKGSTNRHYTTENGELSNVDCKFDANLITL